MYASSWTSAMRMPVTSRAFRLRYAVKPVLGDRGDGPCAGCEVALDVSSRKGQCRGCAYEDEAALRCVGCKAPAAMRGERTSQVEEQPGRPEAFGLVAWLRRAPLTPIWRM